MPLPDLDEANFDRARQHWITVRVFTLTRVEVDYRKAAKVDDLLHIRTRYIGTDGPRILFSQTCFREDEIIAEGEITAVMIHADGRPRRPIRELVKHLESYRWEGEV